MKSNKPEFLLLPDKESPLVFIDFGLKTGSVSDPDGKEGVASFTLSMLLRGTKQKSAKEFHEALDLLGAELHLGKTRETMRMYGVVLKENLKPFLKLFAEALTEPRFDPQEFAKMKAQFKSALLDELSSDDDIADRRFQEHLLWKHPYGKITSGSLETIDGIGIEDLENFYCKYFAAGGAIFSALGPFEKASMKKSLEAIAKALPTQTFSRVDVKAPKFPKGRHLLLLHKPGRTQSQILIGTPGIGYQDKDYTTMQLGNHVFGGGSFSARLMKEVREKRGWSYGAYSWFRASRQPICLSMQTVPATKDTVPALSLMLKLFEGFSRKGISKDEFSFTKKSLLNQAFFTQDTLRKRLDNKVTEKLLGLPAGFYDNYAKRLEALTWARVQKAIKKHTNAKDLFVVVLGDADALEPELKKLKGFKKLTRKNFDEAPGAIW